MQAAAIRATVELRTISGFLPGLEHSAERLCSLTKTVYLRYSTLTSIVYSRSFGSSFLGASTLAWKSRGLWSGPDFVRPSVPFISETRGWVGAWGFLPSKHGSRVSAVNPDSVTPLLFGI